MAAQTNNIRGYDVTIDETLCGVEILPHTRLGDCLRLICSKFVFQLEEGEEKKNKHFQIRLNTIDKMRANVLLKLFKKGLDVKDEDMFKIHIRPTMKDTHNKKNFNYVMKLSSRILGPWTERDFTDEAPEFMYDELIGVTPEMLRPFQKTLYDMVEVREKRIIDFIYDPPGNRGKGFICDYLEAHKGCYILPSIDDYKLIIQDAHNFVTSRQNKYGYENRGVKCFMLDMPKMMKFDKMRNIVTAIETIKSGRFVDYRNKSSPIVRINRPRVFVFTNEPIDMKLYSKDRYRIWVIDSEDRLIPYVEARDLVRQPGDAYDILRAGF